MMDSPLILADSQHNSGAVIRQFGAEIIDELTGLFFQEAYASSALEVILCFTGVNQTALKFKISGKDLLPVFYPHELKRKSATRSIFEDINGLKIKGGKVSASDRIFFLLLEENYQLVFKLFGSMMNIILLQDNKVVEVFRNSIKNDSTFILPPDFVEAIEIERFSFRFDREKFILSKEDIKTELNLIEEMSLFSSHLIAQREFHETKNHLLIKLNQRINKLKKSELLMKKGIEDWNRTELSELKGNLILSSIGLIKPGDATLNANNYITGKDILIKLDPNLSPTENASTYFKKSKLAKSEKQRLIDSLDTVVRDLRKSEMDLHSILNVNSIKALKPFLSEKKKTDEIQTYHETSVDGYQILIGKNAKSNDNLTFHLAGKNDIFLHAKDVTGSHVIIRNRGRDLPPISVIERAAQLAAWFSKARGSSLVPVSYAFRKHVRKPKGMPHGAVLLSTEEVILVSPAAL